jgi:hypothetical protein
MSEENEPKGFGQNHPRMLDALAQVAEANDKGQDSTSYTVNRDGNYRYLIVSEEGYSNPTRNVSMQSVFIDPDSSSLINNITRWSGNDVYTDHILSRSNESIEAHADGRIILRIDQNTSFTAQEYDVTDAAAAIGITAASLNDIAIDTAWDGEVKRDEQQRIIDTFTTLKGLVRE